MISMGKLIASLMIVKSFLVLIKIYTNKAENCQSFDLMKCLFLAFFGKEQKCYLEVMPKQLTS